MDPLRISKTLGAALTGKLTPVPILTSYNICRRKWGRKKCLYLQRVR